MLEFCEQDSLGWHLKGGVLRAGPSLSALSFPEINFWAASLGREAEFGWLPVHPPPRGWVSASTSDFLSLSGSLGAPLPLGPSSHLISLEWR